MVESNPHSTLANASPAPAQDAKGRILAVATQLFGAQGYEATSIQAIAEAVGIRKQSLLYHYPSKEQLLHAVIEAWLLHWREELPKLLAHSSGYDRFSASVSALLAFFRDDPNRARLALREMLDRPDDLRRQMREHLSPWMQLLTDYIRIGQASGRLRPEVNPESYVVQVMLMVVTSVAVGDVASALVAGQGDADATELVRIAREALFLAPTTKTQEG